MIEKNTNLGSVNISLDVVSTVAGGDVYKRQVTNALKEKDYINETFSEYKTALIAAKAINDKTCLLYTSRCV